MGNVLIYLIDRVLTQRKKLAVAYSATCNEHARSWWSHRLLDLLDESRRK